MAVQKIFRYFFESWSCGSSGASANFITQYSPFDRNPLAWETSLTCQHVYIRHHLHEWTIQNDRYDARTCTKKNPTLNFDSKQLLLFVCKIFFVHAQNLKDWIDFTVNHAGALADRLITFDQLYSIAGELINVKTLDNFYFRNLVFSGKWYCISKREQAVNTIKTILDQKQIFQLNENDIYFLASSNVMYCFAYRQKNCHLETTMSREHTLQLQTLCYRKKVNIYQKKPHLNQKTKQYFDKFSIASIIPQQLKVFSKSEWNMHFVYSTLRPSYVAEIILWARLWR